MKHWTVAAVPLALGLVPPLAVPDEVRFEPAEGRTLEKTFALEAETERTTSFESDQSSGTSTSVSTSGRSLVVIDAIVAVDGDRITKLERSFDEITSESESEWESSDGSHVSSGSGESELEGATVTFEWDEDEEEYTPSSDDVDEELVLELAFDLDFLALFPDGAVAEGDEWDIDVDAFELLTNPWDGVSWEWEHSFDGEVREMSDDGDDRPEPDVDESKDGEVTAEFTETREVDGVTVAVIEIAGEIDAERTVDFAHEHDQGSQSSHSESTDTTSISGEVLWLVDEGRLHSAEFEIEVESSGASQNSFSFGDQVFESESEFESTSLTTYTAAFEPVEDDDE